MSKKTFAKSPSYRRQKRPNSADGAFVVLNGHRHYLGRYGSTESRREYHRLLAEWTASSGTTAVSPEEITVVEITARFWKHTGVYYRHADGSPTSEVGNIRRARVRQTPVARHPRRLQERYPYDRNDLKEAVNLFLQCADDLGHGDLYRRNLVDLLKQHLANAADYLMAATAQAYRDRDADALRRHANRFLILLDDIDTLLETRPEHRHARWVESARRCAAAEDEADHYEYNARLQLTRWGGPRSLTDYASKEWSGLIRDYYIPRWRLFFDRLMKGVSDHSYDEDAWHEFMDEWEARWPCETRRISVKPAGDVIDVARDLFERYGYTTSFDLA